MSDLKITLDLDADPEVVQLRKESAQLRRERAEELARLRSEVADLQIVVGYLLRLEGTTRDELRQHAFVQARRRGMNSVQAARESRETWRRLLSALNWQDENHADDLTLGLKPEETA